MYINCKKKTGCLQKLCAFCCTQKRDLMKNDNFEKTIEIFPRIIVLKKTKMFEVFCETITVRNTGTLCRQVKFITEPKSDITFKINGNTNLQPGALVSVDVFVESTKKKLINRDRYFFVIAEHPDIVWEIPFIVLKKNREIYVPEMICLPKVPTNTASNYQFLVYNPQDNEITFSICSNYDGLTIRPVSGTISAKDYLKILVVGKVPPEPITTSILLTLRNGNSFKIFVQMEASNQLIHLSTKELIFEDTYIGMKSQKNLFICNKSNECVSFQWANSEILEHSEPDDQTDEKLIVSDFLTIKNKRGCIPAMNSILSIFSFTPPNYYFYNEEESQFQTNEVVYLYCPILGPQSYRVHISGRILGPKIEINPMELDIGSLYMGQIHCISLDALNKGPIAGEIYFKDHTDQKMINCSVTPFFICLKPDARKSIQLSFYRRDVGKFLTKLIFKIKSGDFLSILLRGISLPTKVDILPEIFEFGNIPMCIPQKASVTILNPLPVSIVVEPIIIDDGVENPLILCVDNTNLPLNTRTSTFYKTNIYNNGRFLEKDLKNSCSDFIINIENSSRTNISSQISSLFQNKVLDDIPAMATEVLQNFKNIHSEDELEIGMKLIDASLNCIFDRCDYFHELQNNRNYLHFNWKALPCDAKEVAIEEERFYLEPNETKTFPVVLIPNSSGPSTKTIQFQVYPMDINNSDKKDTINSKYMINSLRLQYNCMIPILEYNNDIFFSQSVYVDMENTFNMHFKNIDIVPGFVYFKVIPTSEFGIIKVERNLQKFLIGPNEKIEVACSVIFRKVGKIVLYGIFQLVGKLLEYSFKVEANVLAPEIHISTDKIFEKQDVLQLTRTKIFITNTSPTIARLTFSMKNETHQFLEPQGGSLAPNQKILVSIFSKFLDSGLYKNCLYIHLRHCEDQIIPITLSVEGAPLEFEPNIKLGLNFETLPRNKKLQEHIIKIKNLGRKLYKINFQKIISKKLTILPIDVFSIVPNILTIGPNAQEIIKIQLDISKVVKSEEEFCVDAIDKGKHRFKLFSFTAKCNVIESKILWSKNEIRFEKKNFQMNEDKSFDLVSLINTSPFVANVNLNVQGNFVIGEDCQALKEKSLEFCMKGKSSKEIYVCLNEKEIDVPNLTCQCFKGFIKCKVNKKTQKSLPLHVKTVSPDLQICTPKVTLYPPYTDSFAHTNIHNCSLVNANFSWKEVESTLLNKPLSEYNVEQLYSKTISELIPNMPKDTVPKLSNSIKPICSEDFESDQESSDEETQRKRDSSALLNAVEFKKKSSFRSSKNEAAIISSSSSLTSLSSGRSLIQPVSCKPIPSLKAETDINEIFECLVLSEKISPKPSKTFCKNYDLSGSGTNFSNEDELKESTKIGFQQKSGQIPPKSMFKTYIFLPITLPKDKTLVAKYNLEVVGGQAEILDLTVTSQKARIQVSRIDINLGKNIWHKIIVDKIRITSISQYDTKITIVEKINFIHETKHLTDGYVEILSPKQLVLLPKTSMDIKFRVTLGMRQHFFESIGLELNNNTTAIPIHFRGSGVFPMVILTNLKRIPQTLIQTTESYFHFRDLFNDTQRKCIQVDESLPTTVLKNGKEEVQFESTRKKMSTRNQFRDFVLVNYSEDKYPKAEDIERVIETEKFIFNFLTSDDLSRTFDKFYNKCMQFRAMEFDPIINLKLTICRPIPWECYGFSLNMNEAKLNGTKHFVTEMVFVGPGRLFLSLRSKIAIPGLTASFEVTQKNGLSNPFVFFHQSPDDKFLKRYKNIRERSSVTEKTHFEDTKFKNLHSHSYDFDKAGVYQRKKRTHEIKEIKKRYTKISQPMKEKKNLLIITEICQTTDEDLSDLRLKLNLKLTPTNEFYEINQIIEDYLFIDIHLGPTVPILLKGKIVPE